MRVLFLFYFDFLIKLSTSDDRIFFWEGDNLVQPDNLTDESLEYRYLPVIEGELEEVTCTVRAISEAPYKVTVYHEDFKANTTEEREEIDGVQFVKEIVTVNVDNSTAIDEKEILCEINEPTQDTISLLVKAYIIHRIPVSVQTCKDCDGTVTLTVKKASKQKKEDTKLEEGLENKLKKNYGVTAVDIDSNGIVSADGDFNKIRGKIQALNQRAPGWTVDGKEVEDIDTHCDCVKIDPYTEGGVSQNVIVIVIVIAFLILCGLVFFYLMKLRKNNADRREIELEMEDTSGDPINQSAG